MDSIKCIFPLSGCSWNTTAKASFSFSQIFCVDLEHRFCETLSGSGMTKTVILVGIPKSSTDGVWISNGIAQYEEQRRGKNKQRKCK